MDSKNKYPPDPHKYTFRKFNDNWVVLSVVKLSESVVDYDKTAIGVSKKDGSIKSVYIDVGTEYEAFGGFIYEVVEEPLEYVRGDYRDNEEAEDYYDAYFYDIGDK